VAQNDNTGNELSSASITLTDNDGGATAMFTGVPALMPGTNVDRCIDVTYAGTADPTAVVLYANGAPTGDPGTYFNLIVDMAPDIPGAFGDCTSFPTTGTTNVYTGTLAGFAARTTFASSWPTTWDPAAVGPETRTFRFRMSVVDNLSAANRTSTFGFVWETRTP